MGGWNKKAHFIVFLEENISDNLLGKFIFPSKELDASQNLQLGKSQKEITQPSVEKSTW